MSGFDARPRPIDRKARRWGALAVLFAVTLAASPALASTPHEGTITAKNRSVKWSGGPFFVSKPVGSCITIDVTCEQYLLHVNLRPGTTIKVQLTPAKPAKPCCAGPAPASGDDYDLYVWDPDGGIIAESHRNNEGVETVYFRHSAAHAKEGYEIEVVPFMVAPGSTYTGSARVLSVRR